MNTVANDRENPLSERFEGVVDILKKYDTVLLLGERRRKGPELNHASFQPSTNAET